MKNVIKYTIFYLIFTTSIVVAHSLDQDSIVHIETEQDLKNLLQNHLGPSAISFHKDDCGWCIKMRPIFEGLAKEDQFDHITFYSVNGPITKASLHSKEILHEPIVGYPTIFFINQGKLIDKQVGGAGRDVIAKKLNGLLSSPVNKINKKNKTNKKTTKNKSSFGKASQPTRKATADAAADKQKVALLTASSIKAA